MKTPHKHAALIKQWADGAQIQYKYKDGWLDVGNNPTWNEFEIYRIKPEPKPDVVLYAVVEAVHECGHAKIRSVLADVNKIKSDTCMFVFDGETGKLKDAQVLAKE